MNSEAAKFILPAYNPSGQDANDPRSREALGDLELARWFANEQAVDYRISAKVKASITPPAHFKLQLIAQGKAPRPDAWRKLSIRQLRAAPRLVLVVTIAAVWLSLGCILGFDQHCSDMASGGWAPRARPTSLLAKPPANLNQ